MRLSIPQDFAADFENHNLTLRRTFGQALMLKPAAHRSYRMRWQILESALANRDRQAG